MSGTCYGHSSPNAVFLPNYGPCNPQAGSVSLCCESHQICLTNGLCVTQSGIYYNGGCTDSTYKAVICPTFCTSGDTNWVVQCHGSAVKDGDFCCSVNGTTSTCCDTASNGLGLVAAVSSAQAVSGTSVGASTVPATISSGTTTSSSGIVGSTAGSLASTPSPTASQSDGSTGMPQDQKVMIGVTVPIGFLILVGIIFGILFHTSWMRKRRERRQAETTVVELRDLREGSDKSGPQACQIQGEIPAEVEGSHVGAEAEGLTTGPVEMDASQTHTAPTNPPPYRLPTPDLAPDNNPLHEPTARSGSWYNPNLGNL